MPNFSCRLRSLTALTALTMLLMAAMAAGQAQVAPRLAAQARIIPGMPEKAIMLPAPMIAKLRTTKQQADIQELQRTYFVRNGIPHLRALGQEFKLLPLEKLEYQPTPAQAQASRRLVGPITKYKPLIFRERVPLPLLPPQVVDRRPQQTSVKNQNPRGTCYAFASIAAMEAAYGGGSLDLSENYLNYWFMKHEGKGCKDAYVGVFDWGQLVADHGICKESVCPYASTSHPSYCNNGAAYPPARRVDADKRDPYRITDFTPLWRDESVSDSGPYINNPYMLKSALASGKEVVVGMWVAGWTGSNMENVIDVTLGTDGNPLPASGGHVMLVVGYDNPHQYFIVKNSWGTGPGHAGYLYLTYDYIRTYAIAGFIVNTTRPVIKMAPKVFKRIE